MGFYAGFLIVRYLREEIDGPPRRRIAVIVAAAVVEFGPAEIVDTALIRPAAMFLASLATGNVIIGVLIGKVAADIVFYGLAITSYEVLVRRFLHRFRRTVSVDDGGRGDREAADTAGRGDRSPTAEVPPTGPELIMDLDVVTDHFRRFREALPEVAVHFAMKCQPDPPLLRHLLSLGCRFEVASLPELATLIELGVRPPDVIFSNPVKPWWHIRDAYAAGVRRFAADSDAELAKLARYAPGSAVMIRLAVPPAASDVPSEGKFGVEPGRGGPAAAGRGRRRAAPVGTHLPRRFPDDRSAGLGGTDPRGADDHGTAGARRRPARGARHRRRFPGRLRAAGAADRGLRRDHRLGAGHPAVRGRGAGRARAGLWSPTPAAWRPR